jgi:urocanate hydratase
MTDQIAVEVIRDLSEKAPERVKQQFHDNAYWISRVEDHRLVVGSEARILYMNAEVNTFKAC